MPPPPAQQQQQKPGKLYDQLLEFFASAIFQMPVLNFIDQNCMIFCSENDDNAEYREVHLQYKALVSALIGAFCEDTKIKYDDFINALSDFSDRAKGFEGTALKAVYEQVLAAENYSLFVNLMLRHNVELQQQCLLLILREIGNLPPSVIAAATGASIETLQALVATAQGGGGVSGTSGALQRGGASGAGGRGGVGGAPTPEDQELAILVAVLKDSNLNDQPVGSSSSGMSMGSHGSRQQGASQAPPAGKSSTSGGSSGGGLGPLPPVGGGKATASSSTTSNSSSSFSSSKADAETVEKVADFVDKMAGKRAGFDKKVEQEASVTNLNPVSLASGNKLPPLRQPPVISGSMQYNDSSASSSGANSDDEASDGPVKPVLTLKLIQKVPEPLPLKKEPSVEVEKVEKIKEEPVKSPKKTSPVPEKDEAMLNEAGPSNRGATGGSSMAAGSGGSSGPHGGSSSSSNSGGASGGASGGSSSFPPLPGVGGRHATNQADAQASLAAISAMLQPLANDGSAPHYGEAEKMLKNPATQRALEALKNMNADDLVARSEYLKAQRDRLIALKQQQRKSVLDEETKKQGASRPKSARISKQFVDDEKPAAGALSPEDEERLRIRRAIGDSIKRELMASKPDK